MLQVVLGLLLWLACPGQAAPESAKKVFYFNPYFQLDTTVYPDWPGESLTMLTGAVERLQKIPMKDAAVQFATKYTRTTPKNSATLSLNLTSTRSEQLRILKDIGGGKFDETTGVFEALRLWDPVKRVPIYGILILWDRLLPESSFSGKTPEERSVLLQEKELDMTVALAEQLYGFFPYAIEQNATATPDDAEETQIRNQILSVRHALDFIKGLESHPSGRSLTARQREYLSELADSRFKTQTEWMKKAEELNVCRDLFRKVRVEKPSPSRH